MNWKDTLIKSTDFKWKQPKMKTTDDGKLDFDLHLPLTQLFERQAELSFANGFNEALTFLSKCAENHQMITEELILNKLKDCGIERDFKVFPPNNAIQVSEGKE